MKFDFCIGNPPYNSEFTNDGNKTYAQPVYNEFIDAAAGIAEKVELIHPARFLFNAGSTPKAWNEKMLNDEHFKVLHYEEDATNVFPNTEIKGGVAITYHDACKEYEPIKVFLKQKEMNGILSKTTASKGFEAFDKIVISRTAYRLTEKFHEEWPNAKYKEDENGNSLGLLTKGHDYDMSTNIFDRIPMVFYDKKPNDENEYIRIIGREGNERKTKWIRKDYVNNPKPLFKYSIILPKANNSGKFGEQLAQPIITEPGLGSTETFLSIGFFDTALESQNCLKYISTKYARALLGILKTTQDLTPDKWRFVPLQDFTKYSDINWNLPVSSIDQQLYKKYGLTQEEIRFIETNVKEMA